MSPGRRISRDGNFIAFESLADLSGDNSVKSTTTVFVYNVSASSFTQIGPRADISSAFRFPTFTDYTGTTPSTVVFATGLNFKADGTIAATAADGLTPAGVTQIFAAPLSGTITFTRLTNNPGSVRPAREACAMSPRGRISSSMTGTVLGG